MDHVNGKTRNSRSAARWIGIVASLACTIWGIANWRSSLWDTGWYRAAVLLAVVFGPICFAQLVAPWWRVRKR